MLVDPTSVNRARVVLSWQCNDAPLRARPWRLPATLPMVSLLGWADLLDPCVPPRCL
jgi:hypothetical protein